MHAVCKFSIPHELVTCKHDGGGANFLAATSQFGVDEVIISYSMV
jgi:hypothetical protein